MERWRNCFMDAIDSNVQILWRMMNAFELKEGSGTPAESISGERQYSDELEVSEDEEKTERGGLSDSNQATVREREDRGGNQEGRQGSVSGLSYRSFVRKGQDKIRKAVLAALNANDLAAYNYFKNYGSEGFIEKVYDYAANGGDMTALHQHSPVSLTQSLKVRWTRWIWKPATGKLGGHRSALTICIRNTARQKAAATITQKDIIIVK